ncbi:uncharacterized protein LOC122722544 [Manihot esculenta]|uniref:Uncharacterized protein n=1 Tax=Manihot esculenta TaxID=3983 RepID=A0ACB7FYI1_MANES|nr:uncharacterized protein LOC122722544 [Manihot esculenta]KAG8632895.1 hypothetical protein MANES_18G025146v8 [Manihot esculenta]
MTKNLWDFARWLRWDIILSIIAIGAEAISAALEQTSPHKVKAARYGVIMAIFSVLLTFADLACNKYMLIRDKNTRPNKNHHEFRWEFADSFGSISSILTLISSCLYYNFLSNGKQQPIQFSTIPLAFSVCVFCSRVLRQPSHKHKPIFVLNCKLLDLINLDIESGRILFDNDESTQFGCPVCQIEQIHP